MKFDICLMNPPFRGSLHLEFFKKALDISDKIVIVEPATWLINIRKNGKASKYDEIKKVIKGHVFKVIIENMNKEFNIGLYVPCSITYIDMSKTFDKIEYICCGYKKIVNSIYDCNLIGDYDIIHNIINKINVDKVKNHIYSPYNNSIKIKDNYYIPYNLICAAQPIVIYFVRPILAMTDKMFNKSCNGDFYKLFFGTLFHSSYDISNEIPKRMQRGGSTTNNKKFTDVDSECITGTKEELENWKHFVFNNKLPLFLNICLTIDQHNNSLNYVPWLVDKQYTDEEINELFGFTDEEIKLIDKTIKKFERYSPWFKRYMCGPLSVSDEEVQKYIDTL